MSQAPFLPLLAYPPIVTGCTLCMQLTITQNPKAAASNEVLPVSYPKFTTMIQKGDTIFIGRYLVTGSEDSSLYVQVCSRFKGAHAECPCRDAVRCRTDWQSSKDTPACTWTLFTMSCKALTSIFFFKFYRCYYLLCCTTVTISFVGIIVAEVVITTDITATITIVTITIIHGMCPCAVQVDDIQGDDVVCTAANHATLDGLVTIFHTERSSDVLNNVQNDLPIMTDDDKSAIKELAAEFEIDFINLSFTRAGEDVVAAREFLDSNNMQTTKVRRESKHISGFLLYHLCSGIRCMEGKQHHAIR